MIPEQREQLEQNSMLREKEPKLKNRLQEYLRSEFSYESLQNPEVKKAAISRTALVVKDFAIRNGIQMTDEQALHLSKYAVINFLDNWEGKEEGTDDRSHWTQKFINRLNSGVC